LEIIAPAVTTILLNLFLAVLTAVAGWVVMFVKSKLNENQLALAGEIAANVVLAVEQNNYGKELVNAAEVKKDEAIALMNSFLKKYSITLTEEQIDATIEAAVGNVLNANKLIEPPKVIEVSSGIQDDGFVG
jgi:Na+-translocating ferredoxin:NAD+ oxidoreductase RnfG subunit